jgi:putative peptide zinc metalloprotease protein
MTQLNVCVLRRPEVELLPDPTSDRMIVSDHRDGRQFRLTKSAGQVLELLNGQRNANDVGRVLGIEGSDQFESEISRAIERFTSLDLVSAPVEKITSERRKPKASHRISTFVTQIQRPGRRIRYSRPASIEINFGNPERVLQRLETVGNLLAKPFVQSLVWLFTATGITAAIKRHDLLTNELGRPASLNVILTILVATVLVTAIHELAHGVALHRRGGRVRRLGFILLYGSPSLFCDVSQAWRLPRRDRVQVALAGVRVNAFMGSLAGILLLFCRTSTGTSQALSILVVAELSMVLANLVPFVKFDGYIALVGWTDTPHLRLKSMQLAGSKVSRLVFGRGQNESSSTELKGNRWLLFGVASAVTGPLLGAMALVNYGSSILLGFGRFGAVAILLAYAALIFVPAKKLAMAIIVARKRGVSLLRRLLGATAVVVATTALLFGVHVPSIKSVVFQRISGVTYLDASTGSIPLVGSTVTLHQSGILLHPLVGTAQVCGTPEMIAFDHQAGSPMVLPASSPKPTQVVRLCPNSPLGITGGMASIQVHTVSLATWLQSTFVGPSLQTLHLSRMES